MGTHDFLDQIQNFGGKSKVGSKVPKVEPQSDEDPELDLLPPGKGEPSARPEDNEIRFNIEPASDTSIRISLKLGSRDLLGGEKEFKRYSSDQNLLIADVNKKQWKLILDYLEQLQSDVYYKKICDALRKEIRDQDNIRVCHLIDSAATNIPWEMLLVDDGKFLGAHVDIARYVPGFVYENYCGEDVTSEFDDEVISYLTDEPEMKDDIVKYQKPVIDRIRGRKPYQKMSNLWRSLARTSDKRSPYCKVVYFLGHGTIDALYSHKEDIKKPDPNNGFMDCSELRRMSLRRIREARSLVFLNACFAGSLSGTGEHARGFAKIFIQNGAIGFISSLGEIHRTYAVILGSKFLTALNRGGELSVASWLRQQRYNAQKLLNSPKEDKRNLQQFLTIFLYVFYGHPKTVVRLRRRQVATESSQEPMIISEQE